jgi:FkbM family methyltransferase
LEGLEGLSNPPARYNLIMVDSPGAENQRNHASGPAEYSEYSPLATDEDIYYSYRLLLGRNPDLHGFHTHQSLLKERPVPVTELVEIFLTSPEFRNRCMGLREAPYVLTNLAGFRMYASPDDWSVGKHIIERRVHEPHVTQLMRKFLGPGMTFVDIGANIGYFTLLARSLVGKSGKVYAFEPSPSNAALLQINLGLNGFDDVELFPYALANASRLFVYDHQGSNGTLSELPDNIPSLSSRTVIRSVVFDQVVSLDRCDVIKIDVEGAEWMALQGAWQTIRRHHPAIFSEFSPDGLSNVSGVSGKDYLELLFGEGYRVAAITPKGTLTSYCRAAGPMLQIFEESQASHIDILATVEA